VTCILECRRVLLSVSVGKIKVVGY